MTAYQIKSGLDLKFHQERIANHGDATSNNEPKETIPPAKKNFEIVIMTGACSIGETRKSKLPFRKTAVNKTSM